MTTTLSTEDFLSHYGVKGMKWGQRKSEGGVTKSKSGSVKEAASEDAAKVGKTHARVKSQKSTKMLSNKELREAIERMNLEQQYSRMTGGLDKTRKQKAQSFIRDMVKKTVDGSSQQVSNKVSVEVGRQVDQRIKKATGQS